MKVQNSVYARFARGGSRGYGPVVPFPAYGFASLVSHNEDLKRSKKTKQSPQTQLESYPLSDVTVMNRPATNPQA
eukprot:scaffold17428_cov39-Phaeocystis_antarctica.AAC.1